jgi:hypothetical protein
MEKGDRNGALGAYRDFVKANPDNAMAHFMLGAQIEAAATEKSPPSYRLGPDGKLDSHRSHMSPAVRQMFEEAMEQY